MLIEEYRGSVLENTHDGRVCVVDENGRVVCSTGDTGALTYYRSASKPFQVIPLLTSGLNKKYGLSEDEIVVCSASHAGEEMHIAALKSIMRKTGLKEDDMIMLPAWPANRDCRDAIMLSGGEKRRLYHNCAGKHLALMLLQRELTGKADGYHRPDSPAQQKVLQAVASVSDYPKEQIGCGIDGCGVPVFAVPQRGIAAAYMRLAFPDGAAQDIKDALGYIADCIAKHPYMIRGRGYLCGEINTLKNFVAKGGAEGVYGFGLKKERLGVSIKIADGSEGVWPIVVAEVLRQLNYKDDGVYALLKGLKSPVKTNDNLAEIGSYRPVFALR